MKRVAIGLSDFKEIRDNNRYFIDKTLIIKEFIEDSSKIVLIPRPRRFGKTLNLSIVKYFLAKSEVDNSYLYKGTNIEKENDIMKLQGTFPVIYLTLKDEKHNDFDKFIESMKKQISSLYKNFYYIYEDIKFENDKIFFNNLINEACSVQDLEVSLLKLSEYLKTYHNHKVIILMDEYDTPIHQGYFKNYYDEMIGFMRNFLSAGLKDNINLEKAMITGILNVLKETHYSHAFLGVSDSHKRQAFGSLLKESIFSGMNNLAVYSLLSYRYSDKFGFTEEETTNLLKYYSLDAKIDNFKNWYNGYIFGETTIYNPWSVLCYINEPERNFMPYWVNTADDKIIRTLLAKGNSETKVGLESLYNGGDVQVIINEDTVMAEIDKTENNIWSFLLLSGYLKAVSRKFDESRSLYIYKLKIPNIEIKTLYRTIIDKWFSDCNINSQYNNMIKALTLG
ncbi:MAG: AAA family ATPase, partial [Clostridium sp.]